MNMTDADKKILLQDLFEGLRVNMKLCEDILVVIKEEGKALKSMDTQTLFKLSKQKENLLAKTHYLDDSLKGTIGELDPDAISSDAKNNATGAVSTARKLAELAPGLSAQDAEMIKKYNKKLTKLRQEIQIRNQINKKFTEDTLLYLNEAISMITQPVQTQKTYGSGGLPPTNMRSLPSMISREV